MKNRFLLGAGVALALAFSWGGGAQAQLLAAPSGPGIWYFGGEGGWTSLENASGKLAGVVGMRQGFGNGFNAGGRLGYEWGPWRFEEEIRYQQNSADRLCILAACVRTSGNRNAVAFMTNAIYDFSFAPWAITPHVGVGVGAVELHDSVSIPGIGTFSRSTDWEFGYQAIAGVRYNINPSLAFDLDYRFLGTTQPTFKSVVGKYTSGYDSHSLLASLSIRFGVAAPLPPPAPPAPPAIARKVFLVFFDWDKDRITPEGMAIVQQAAAAFRGGAPVTIQVTGYTDRSGSPGYNQRLSERRANNVANALVQNGVPRQAMVVSGRGENDNRVPTAPGVREPQNRRVEIVFP